VAVAGWIGEWKLAAVGAGVRALMGLAIASIVWRAPTRSVLKTRRVERA